MEKLPCTLNFQNKKKWWLVTIIRSKNLAKNNASLTLLLGVKNHYTTALRGETECNDCKVQELR